MRRLALRGVLAVLTLGWMTALGAAQTTGFKVLHSFAGGSDGAYPTTSLVSDQYGNLYGTTGEGGSGCYSYGCGTAFELSQRNGRWGYRQLLQFSSATGETPNTIGHLVVDKSGNIYGTDHGTGDALCDCGTVFELTETGGVWSQNPLHIFTGAPSDGSFPSGLVTDFAGNLYGASQNGGANGAGTVFQLTPNADGTWNYNLIHSFGGGGVGGVWPSGPIAVDSSGSIYGTTLAGGFYGYGTVYKLALSGEIWTETTIYNFTLEYGQYQDASGIAIDPVGNLYGTTLFGGLYSLGTLYKLSPAVGFWKRTLLYTFTGGNDGAQPQGGLLIDTNGAIFGTASFAGIFGYGNVFKLVKGPTGKWAEATLHQFRSTDGSYPQSGVILGQSGILFGTTAGGGAYGQGVVFQISQ